MISVVIPAYNESEIIGKLIGELKIELNNNKNDYEIIVVDDGSKDSTGIVAESAGAKVISHPNNIGNGAAVKTGVRNAIGDFIVLMDGDGQHNPRDIKKLLDFIPRYDMVIGARVDKKSGSKHRNLANTIYNILASYLTHFKVVDLTSGFRIIKKEIILKFLYLLPNTFSYPSTITLALLRSGYSLKYVPVIVNKRVGKSKINLFIDGVRFLIIMMKISTLFSPLRIFIPMSTIFFGIGTWHFIYKVSILGEKYTEFTIFIFIISILIFLLGLISEQIAQLRYERSNH